MSVQYELPDLAVGTGGTDGAAGSMLCVGVNSPRMPGFFSDCTYCLDAPDYMPAGAMKQAAGVAGQIYVQRGAA